VTSPATTISSARSEFRPANSAAALTLDAHMEMFRELRDGGIRRRNVCYFLFHLKLRLQSPGKLHV
jgi:hypothetical protein